jgi:uncharacterized protein (DUF1778 family)
MATILEPDATECKTRRKNIQFSIRTDSDTKARAERAAIDTKMTLTEFVETAVRERTDEVLARQDQILLTDRDFLLFEELLTRRVEPNELVRSEVAEFNKGHFDAQGRYHW